MLLHHSCHRSRDCSSIDTLRVIRVAVQVSPKGGANATECPMCLQLMQAPVTLSCMHTFCWGCITMYCLGVFHSKRDASPGGHPKSASMGVAPSSMSQLMQGWSPVAAGDGISAGSLVHQQAHFGCPVCQRKQNLDFDSLTVDSTLAAFVKTRSPLARRTLPEYLEATCSSGAVTVQQTLSAQSDDDSLRSEAVPISPKLKSASTQSEETAVQTPATSSDVLQSWTEALLPPQHPRWRSKLSIVLDVDGTLIASFPPRRAPKLPQHMRTHVVGTGSSLNPQGVY
jgi:carboxy-terminal domain RNA polymerase II polypeptide A small phosphatase